MMYGLLLLVTMACNAEQIWERCGCEGSEICVREPAGNRCAPNPPECAEDSCGDPLDAAAGGRDCREALLASCGAGTEWDGFECWEPPEKGRRPSVLDCADLR